LETINKKYCLFFLVTAVISFSALGQSKSGIENYHYMGNKINYTWAPVVHNLSEKGMYTEMRYNYEELKTASLYVGRVFNTSGAIESSFTPAAGIVVGRYTGASVALNTELSYRNIFFNSQAQYTVSAERTADNFYFNWSDLYYMSLPWLFTGLSMQQTGLCNTAMKTETGVLMGFSKGKWRVPLYLFNVMNDQKYFIVGLNVEWERINKK
jgi:hypothetical protein